MIYQSDDPLRDLTRRSTLRFKWALAEGEVSTPREMWQRVREIVHNEMSVLSDADMIYLHDRYREFQGLPCPGPTENEVSGPINEEMPSLSKEEMVREELEDYLRSELGVMLENILEGGLDVYVRVRRREIEIEGFGLEPSQPRPEPRTAKFNQHAHY